MAVRADRSVMGPRLALAGCVAADLWIIAAFGG
jgi:hypothetical protein